jgi:hypothetical protein
MMDPYVSDKLREIEAELTRRAAPFAGRAPTPVLGPLARIAGRALRRVGERLESWSTPVIPGQVAAPLGSQEESCEGC